MKITIKYFGFFEDLVDRTEETMGIEGDDFRVQDLLTLLSAKYGAKFTDTLIDAVTRERKEDCVFLLNNRRAELDQRIEDGDVVYFLPFLAGG
jgi:MoaD family protein